MVSIIVPVYNVENYIKSCINSLLNQSYHNIEILLVDDGSTDKGGKICDEYAQQDDRIKTIHQENSGVSAARNKGLSEANGEYVCFVDADDRVKADMVKRLMQEQERTGADLVICGYDIEAFRNSTRSMESIYVQDLREQGNVFLNIYNKGLLNSVFNKLFRKDLIGSFHVGRRLGEDLEFVLSYLEGCRSVSVLKDALYVYTRRLDSATTIFDRKKLQSELDVYRDMEEFIESYFGGEITESVIQNLTQNFACKVEMTFESPFMAHLEKKEILDIYTEWKNSKNLVEFKDAVGEGDYVFSKEPKEIYHYYWKKTFVKRYFRRFFFNLKK